MTNMIQGRYRLEGEPGRGAMGIVWRAFEAKLGHRSSLRSWSRYRGRRPAKAADRFLIEAQAAPGPAHPNIVTVHEVISDEGRAFNAADRHPALARRKAGRIVDLVGQ